MGIHRPNAGRHGAESEVRGTHGFPCIGVSGPCLRPPITGQNRRVYPEIIGIAAGILSPFSELFEKRLRFCTGGNPWID